MIPLLPIIYAKTMKISIYVLSVYNISPGFMQCISVTVGCDDLGAPYVTRMHTHNRRGVFAHKPFDFTLFGSTLCSPAG